MSYADRHHYLLADGEEVISNRYGQADRHRELFKAINDNRLAESGTTGLASIRSSIAAAQQPGGYYGRGSVAAASPRRR